MSDAEVIDKLLEFAYEHDTFDNLNELRYDQRPLITKCDIRNKNIINYCDDYAEKNKYDYKFPANEMYHVLFSRCAYSKGFGKFINEI